MSSRSGRNVILNEDARSRRSSGNVFERLGSQNPKERDDFGPSRKVPSGSSRAICRYWAESGSCRFDDCRFIHENPTAASESKAETSNRKRSSQIPRERPDDASSSKKTSSHRKERSSEEKSKHSVRKDSPLKTKSSRASVKRSLEDLSDISDDDCITLPTEEKEEDPQSGKARVSFPLPSVGTGRKRKREASPFRDYEEEGGDGSVLKKGKVAKIDLGEGGGARGRERVKRKEERRDGGREKEKGKKEEKKEKRQKGKEKSDRFKEEKIRSKERDKGKEKLKDVREKSKGDWESKEVKKDRGRMSDTSSVGGREKEYRGREKEKDGEAKLIKKEKSREKKREDSPSREVSKKIPPKEEKWKTAKGKAKETPPSGLEGGRGSSVEKSRKRKHGKSSSPVEVSKEKRKREPEEGTHSTAPTVIKAGTSMPPASLPVTELHIVDEAEEDVGSSGGVAQEEASLAGKSPVDVQPFEVRSGVDVLAEVHKGDDPRLGKDSRSGKERRGTPGVIRETPPKVKEGKKSSDKSKGRERGAKSERRELTKKEAKKKEEDSGRHHESRREAYRHGRRGSDRERERSSYRRRRDRSKERGHRERGRSGRESESEWDRKRDEKRVAAAAAAFERDVLSELQLETLSDADSDGLEDNPDHGQMMEMMAGRDAGILVDWAALVDRESGKARMRESGSFFKDWMPAAVLSEVGVSSQLAGKDLMAEVLRVCPGIQQEGGGGLLGASAACLAAKRVEEGRLILDIGPCRRALTARRDLSIRAKLRVKSDQMLMPSVQPPVTDKELYLAAISLYKENADADSDGKYRLVESKVGSVLLHA